MISIANFESTLVALPATLELLMSANLIVHPSVSRIILHGSRGLAGGYCPMSDIDLSLIVDILPPSAQPNLGSFLREVLEITRNHWRAVIQPDLAIIFETTPCGLKCFDETRWNPELCAIGGVDCFGLYKVGKGFNGFVTNAGVQVKQMYPCLKIWQRTY